MSYGVHENHVSRRLLTLANCTWFQVLGASIFTTLRANLRFIFEWNGNFVSKDHTVHFEIFVQTWKGNLSKWTVSEVLINSAFEWNNEKMKLFPLIAIVIGTEILMTILSLGTGKSVVICSRTVSISKFFCFLNSATFWTSTAVSLCRRKMFSNICYSKCFSNQNVLF